MIGLCLAHKDFYDVTEMTRAIAWPVVVVAFLAMAIVAWRWVDREEPPPLGPIAFATAVPDPTSAALIPETYCSPSVPGWNASGDTEMSQAELVAWYSDRFGPVNDQVTEFINEALNSPGPGYPGPRTLVLEDLQVIYDTLGNGSTWFAVRTYESVSHLCPPRGTDVWDPEQITAWSYEGICGQVIHFYGVEFGARGYGTNASDQNRASLGGPPEGWDVLLYPNGRSVSWSLEDPSRIYANPGDGNWYEYNRDNLCYLD